MHPLRAAPTLVLAVLLLAVGTPAQDLEPDLAAAVASAVGELRDRLPAVQPSPRALALAGGGTAARLVAEALLAEGFTVAAAPAPDHLTIRVEHGPEWIRLDAESRILPGIVRRHGDAHWVGTPPPHAITVRAHSRQSADRALAEAERLLRRALADRLGAAPDAVLGLEIGHRSFVAERADGTGTLWVAFAQLDAPPSIEAHLRAMLDEAGRQRLRDLFGRGLSSLALGILVLLAYWWLDLRTRGYVTTPLRVLCGTVLASGVAWIWLAIP
jgi:hypothetical protein